MYVTATEVLFAQVFTFRESWYNVVYIKYYADIHEKNHTEDMHTVFSCEQLRNMNSDQIMD